MRQRTVRPTLKSGGRSGLRNGVTSCGCWRAEAATCIEAAQVLGLSRSALYQKLRKHRIAVPSIRGKGGSWTGGADDDKTG